MSASYALRAAMRLLASCLAVGACAEPVPPPTCPTVVVLCRGLLATDLSAKRLPSLRALANRGSVGLLTMPPAIAATPETAMLSMAIGGPATGMPADRAAYRADERVEGASPLTVLERRTGRRYTENASQAIVHIGIASLHRRHYADRLVSARAQPAPLAGSMGVELPPGLRHADERRLAALFAIDRDGLAPEAATHSARFTVVSVGSDLFALDRRIHRAIAAGARVWVVGYPRSQGPRGYLVQPALTVLAGPDVPAGVLTSPTTRTPGLISYVDVVPTLLAWTGGPGDPRDTGHAVEAAAAHAHLAALARLDRTMAANTVSLVPVLLASGIFAGVAMLMGLAALRFAPILAPSARALCYAAMPLPISFMATGPAAWLWPEPLTPGVVGAVIGALSAALAGAYALGLRLRGTVTAPAMLRVAMAVMAGVIILDAWTGQRLMKSSILAAAGTAGARFYGIGNEYMAFLVASATGLAMMSRYPRRAAWILMLPVILSLGLGRVGANAGGVVTAVSTLAVMLATLNGRNLRMRWALLGILMGVAAALLFAGLDQLLSGSHPSHLGDALAKTDRNAVAVMAPLIVRKLAMNAGAASSPHGLFALVGITAVLGSAFALLRSDIVRVASQYPGWRRWRWPAIVGALTALIANDTGVVAMLIIFGAFAYAGLVLRLNMPSEPNA